LRVCFRPYTTIFSKSPKRHLEFTKLMETKGANILKNVKTCWIFILSFVRRVMAKYRTLLIKMTLDAPINDKEKTNFDLLSDVCRFCWGLLPFCCCWNYSII
jgi:hypothetical protein